MRFLKHLLTFSILFFSIKLFAQGPPPITQPEASPRSYVKQTIGITKVSIDYGRPGVKDRKILGGIVPYDQVWRCGANENTRISFNRAVQIGDKLVDSGTYGVHMIPGEEKWTVILSSDHESWGSYFYDQDKDVVRVEASPEKTNDKTEWMEYGFEDLSANGASVYLKWDNFKVSFPVKVSTEEQMIAHIENEYLKNLAGFFWQGFNNAAMYCVNNDVELEKGLKWAETSIQINKNFANMSTKSLIMRRMNNTKEADKFIKEAMPMSDEASVNTYGYALLYTLKDTDAAIKVFKQNVKEYPNSWNVYDSLAEAQAVNGDKDNAIKNFETALSKAPDGQKERIKATIKNLKS